MLSSIQLRKKAFPHGHGYIRAVKELRHAGGLTNLGESDEINACISSFLSIVDGKTEEWLLLFKMKPKPPY